MVRLHAVPFTVGPNSSNRKPWPKGQVESGRTAPRDHWRGACIRRRVMSALPKITLLLLAAALGDGCVSGDLAPRPLASPDGGAGTDGPTSEGGPVSPTPDAASDGAGNDTRSGASDGTASDGGTGPDASGQDAPGSEAAADLAWDAPLDAPPDAAPDAPPDLAPDVAPDVDPNAWMVVLKDDFSTASTTLFPGGVTGCGGLGSILGGTPVLGEGATIAGTIPIATPHREMRVKFKFVVIDSWDGEEASLQANGQKVWSHSCQGAPSFNCNQDYPQCGNAPIRDGVVPVEVVFPHTASQVDLLWSTALDQPPIDESWGLDDLEIAVR